MTAVINMLLIALLVLFAAYTVYIISGLLARSQTSRFFDENKVKLGKVVKYEIVKGATYSTMSWLAPGVSAAMIPHLHHTPDVHSVVLECWGGGKHFQARYAIPAEDYKENKVGETVPIKDGWEPVEVQEL